jgi:hypothetical protein
VGRRVKGARRAKVGDLTMVDGPVRVDCNRVVRTNRAACNRAVPWLWAACNKGERPREVPLR